MPTTSAKRVSQGALGALKDALAVVYWYKPDFETFVRGSVSRPEILTRLNFQEPKRRVAGELVEHLAADQARYFDDLLSLMGELVAFDDDFPHLARLDDGKAKVASARAAVGSLRKYYDGHATIVAQREEAAERRERHKAEGARTRADCEKLDELRSTTSALFEVDPQRRGYELEKVLRELFDLFDLDAKSAFKISGEQIDGAFTFEGIDYLLEARWQADLVEPAALDVFDGKIRRKLENTLGLFIAINGFAETAVRNHSRARPTMILMEGADLWAVLESRIPLSDMLRRKRRHASQTGDILLRISQF